MAEGLLSEIQRAVTAMHGCSSTHVGTYYVHETMDGKAVWEGAVEIFNLHGHPKANRAFAWAWDDDGELRYIAILNVSPINSPDDAVRVAITSGRQRQRSLEPAGQFNREVGH